MKPLYFNSIGGRSETKFHFKMILTTISAGEGTAGTRVKCVMSILVENLHVVNEVVFELVLFLADEANLEFRMKVDSMSLEVPFGRKTFTADVTDQLVVLLLSRILFLGDFNCVRN